MSEKKRKRDCEEMESEPPTQVRKIQNLIKSTITDPTTKKIIYEGEIDKNTKKYSGKGKLFDKCGNVIYSGEFSNGLFHGSGSTYKSFQTTLTYVKQVDYVCNENSKFSKFLSGVFRDGNPVGTVKMYHDNGVVLYEGKISKKTNTFNDKNAKLWNKNGKLIYEGAFEKSKFHGIGILYDHINTNKIIHKGEFFYGFVCRQNNNMVELQQLSDNFTIENSIARMTNCQRTTKKGKGIIKFEKCQYIHNGIVCIELFDGEKVKLKTHAKKGVEYDEKGRVIYIGKFDKPFSTKCIKRKVYYNYIKNGDGCLYYYPDMEKYKVVYDVVKKYVKQNVSGEFFMVVEGKYESRGNGKEMEIKNCNVHFYCNKVSQYTCEDRTKYKKHMDSILIHQEKIVF